MRKTLSIFFLLLLASMLTLTTLPMAKAHTITVDGDPSDWIGTAPTTNNTWMWSEGEWIWTDELGDDTGNGSYTYPTAAGVFTGNGCADLLEFRMTWDADNVYFLLTFDNITDMAWVPTMPVEMSTTAVAICIDTDLDSGSGVALVDDGLGGIVANVYLPDEALWEYLIEIALQDLVLWYWDGMTITDIVRAFPNGTNTNVTETFECSIPIDPAGEAGLPDPEGQDWRLFLFVGTQDYEHFREVVGGPSQDWLGGGGADHDYDPRVYDCAFFETKADQEAALNDFTDSDYATLPFSDPASWREIPEFPLPFGFALIAIVVLVASFKIRKKLDL